MVWLRVGFFTSWFLGPLPTLFCLWLLFFSWLLPEAMAMLLGLNMEGERLLLLWGVPLARWTGSIGLEILSLLRLECLGGVRSGCLWLGERERGRWRRSGWWEDEDGEEEGEEYGLLSMRLWTRILATLESLPSDARHGKQGRYSMIPRTTQRQTRLQTQASEITSHKKIKIILNLMHHFQTNFIMEFLLAHLQTKYNIAAKHWGTSDNS